MGTAEESNTLLVRIPDYKRRYFTCDLFGEFVSYEEYIRGAEWHNHIEHMTSEEMLELILPLSEEESDALFDFDLYESGGCASFDLENAREYLGCPPPETTLECQETDPQTERFCRARHQRLYQCSWCGYTMRRVITWSRRNGFVYPTPPGLCTKCPAPVAMIALEDYYIARMPQPFEYDPEPLRTAEVAALPPLEPE